jgi:group I intron endonuclease
MGYIYKVTNIVTGKVYIGETKVADPNERWKQHINNMNRTKGGCPALKDAMKAYGVDKFRFTVLIICFDESRLEMEREYIKRYNSMVPNGYNILEGGQMGGGFKGKKHSAETVKVIQEKLKIFYETKNTFYENNPKEKEKFLAKCKESMKKVDTGACMRASVKFNKAVAEGRIGGKNVHHNPEVKNKISISLKKYFEKNASHEINIEKHRESMAKAKGRPVHRCDKDGKILATYVSVSDAARYMSVRACAIQRVLKGEPHFTCCGWHWRFASP